MRSRGRLFLVLGAMTLALRASAQTPAPSPSPQTPAPTPPPLTLEVGVDVVSVTAVVFDKGGRFVPGLGPKDVQLTEDGVGQEVSYFREAAGPGEERIPLSIVLVLDTSGSMNRNIRFLQEAVLNFVYKLEEMDSALVVSFNESVKGSVEFTNDTDRLERFVDGLQAWGGTSLYDALHYSLGRIKDEPGRKAIVLFSDGADTTSSMRDQDVIDYARAVEATVYSIGFQGGGSGMFGGSAKGFLKKVADETGGTTSSRTRWATSSRSSRRSPASSRTTTCSPTRPSAPRTGATARSLSRSRAAPSAGTGPQGLLRGQEAAARAEEDGLALSRLVRPE